MSKLEEELSNLTETALRISHQRNTLLGLVKAGVLNRPHDSAEWSKWLKKAEAVLKQFTQACKPVEIGDK